MSVVRIQTCCRLQRDAFRCGRDDCVREGIDHRLAADREHLAQRGRLQRCIDRRARVSGARLLNCPSALR